METTPSETPSSPESTTPKSSSTPIGKALIFPVVFLSIAALVWILAVAAANTDWYHASTDVTIAGTSVTATSTYTLTYAKTTQCISGICGSSIASYTELDTQTNFNQVQAATRGLLITGILVETGLVFYLGTLLLSYFVVQVDDIIKRYNKLFFFVGLGLSALATTLFLLSWLSYLGLPRAIRKDADGDVIFI